ncbi:hypothetical protein OAC88_01320 [Flavobacteriaceae bacterium]|nr:hypothetical protein [Flavobacteriaceae bacterium]
MKTELKPPQWLQISVILLLIWNLVGVYAFITDLLLDPSTLDQIQQDFRSQFPLWIQIIYGLAVGLGTVGTFGLLRRKSWSKNILVFSLLCVIIQMYYSMFIAGAIDTFGISIAKLPTVVVILSLTLVWIAQLYRRKGWFI